MNILHLRYAVEVEKTASMTKAADNLYVGQPTLSRGIKDLEDSLGIKIFKRTAKGIIPTLQGEEFLAYANSILLQIDEVKTVFSQEKNQKINFSISAPRTDYICRAFVKTVSQFDSSKEMDINYKETNAIRAVDNIIQGNYSLGIIKFQEDFMPYFETMLQSKNLKYKLIIAYEAKLLVAKNGILGIKDVVDADTLKSGIEVCYGDPFVPTLPSMTAKKAEFTQSSNKRIMVYERSSVCQLLETVPNAYTWISGMPGGLKNPDNFKFAMTDGVEHKKYVHFLIWKKNHKFTKEEDLFLENLEYFKKRNF